MNFSWTLTASDTMALGALILAGISLVVSIWTIREQKRQWHTTTMGRVEVTSARFIFWRTLTQDEASHMKWGYNVNLMPLLEDGKVSQLLGLPSRLVLIDTSSNQALPDITALTLSELEEKAKGYPSPPRTVAPAKQYQLEFTFENVGATPVSQLRIAIDTQMPDSGTWSDGEWSQPIELSPGKSIFKLSDLTSPMNAFLPDRVTFRLRLEYQNVEGEPVTRDIPLYFHSQSGSFNLGA